VVTSCVAMREMLSCALYVAAADHRKELLHELTDQTPFLCSDFKITSVQAS